jgi:hypothetical protein
MNNETASVIVSVSIVVLWYLCGIGTLFTLDGGISFTLAVSFLIFGFPTFFIVSRSYKILTKIVIGEFIWGVLSFPTFGWIIALIHFSYAYTQIFACMHLINTDQHAQALI